MNKNLVRVMALVLVALMVFGIVATIFTALI